MRFVPYLCIFMFASSAALAKWEDYALYDREGITDAIVAINAAIDKGDKLDEARRLTKAARKKFPKSSNVYFESARAELLNVEAENNFHGYRFSGSTINQAQAYLDAALTKLGSDGREYSLMLYMYAINSDIEKARNALQKFEASGAYHLWFEHNRAMLHIAEEEYDQAFTLLDTLVDNPDTRNPRVKRSSYIALRKLRALYPKYERHPLVKNGLFRRVDPERLVQYIENYKGRKPLFVHVSSIDPACQYCMKDIPRIAASGPGFKKDFHFILTTIEPWRDIRYYGPIRKKLFLAGLPGSYTFKNNKIVHARLGSFAQDKVVKWFLNSSRFEVKENNIHRFDNIETDFGLQLREYKAWSLLKRYKKNSAQYKALAIKYNQRNRYAFVSAVSKVSQKEATKQAIEKCKKAKFRGNGGCEMFAVGNKLVFQGVDDGTLELIRRDVFKE